MSPSTRLTGDERREAVIRAATREFAARGFAGTSTEAIARRVGVSQPYLFQLFGTKKELFIAAVRLCFARTAAAFEETGLAAAVRRPQPTAVLKAMGRRYVELLRDRQMLRLQLQSYAACDDPEIRAVVQQGFTELYATVARVSGADKAALQAWFAKGMLLNIAAAIGNANPKDPLSMAALVKEGEPS
jgi:AcrR family transcriptional regulator